jgi:hypothetical protein
MADTPPPAKRVKYIFKDPEPIASITNRSRFNFNEIFEVLTGEKPNQKCFTVHRQPFTERSKFLEAATSSRWTSGTKKPVDVTEHAPEVFASYMQCIYHGSVSVPELPEYSDDNCLGGLIALYLLADQLNDVITANLVIDETMRASEEFRRLPHNSDLTLVYESTIAGNPLRKLCRDYYVYEARASLLEDFEEDVLPFQFVKDVLLEFENLASDNVPYFGRGKTKCVKRERCYYHRHDDEHPRCS